MRKESFSSLETQDLTVEQDTRLPKEEPLGAFFDLSAFLEMVENKRAIDKGFPGCRSYQRVKMVTDSYSNFFRNVQKSNNCLSSLYDFEDFLEDHFLHEVEGYKARLTCRIIKNIPGYTKFCWFSEQVYQEYIDSIKDHLVDLSANYFKNKSILLESADQTWRNFILPPGVKKDWQEAMACLIVKQYKAGCMMGFRAAEGMLRTLYENLTGQPSINGKDQKTYDGQNKDQIDDKTMKWEEIVRQLKSRDYAYLREAEYDRLTNVLIYGRKRRNDFAHGSPGDILINSDEAEKYLEDSREIITKCTDRLIEKKKSLFVYVPPEPVIEVALVLWMLDNFGGGIAKIAFLPGDKSPTRWYSYNLRAGEIDPEAFIYMFHTEGRIENAVAASLRRVLKYIREDTQSNETPLSQLIKELTRKRKPEVFYPELQRLIGEIIQSGRIIKTSEDLLYYQKLLFD